MRTTAVLSTIALSGAMLTGCGSSGGSSSSNYCDELKAAKSQFSSLNSGTPDFNKFSDAIATFHKIADDAPQDISADWKKLDGALTKLESDLKSAGLSLKDLGTITAGGVPEGMTQDQLTAALPKLQSAFSSLSGSDLEAASKNIEKNAKSECKIDLTK
jgi:hypothetical protein